MFLLRLIEFIFLIFVIAIMLTQVIVPLLLNEKTFWLFRKKAAKKEAEILESEVAEAKARVELNKMQEELQELRELREVFLRGQTSDSDSSSTKKRKDRTSKK